MRTLRAEPTRRELWADRGKTVLDHLIGFLLWPAFLLFGLIVFAIWGRFFTESPDQTFLMAKVIIGIVGLAMLAFAVCIFIQQVTEPYHVREQMYPTEIVPPFKPRQPPLDGNWQAWLKRGIRLGRLCRGAQLLGVAWLRIIDTHILDASESRYGKSVRLSNFMEELRPAVEHRAARIFLFDPSNGMQFGWATENYRLKGESVTRTPLVAKEDFYYGEDVGKPVQQEDGTWTWEGKTYEETFLRPVERLVEMMNERTGQLRFRTHSHVATPGDPHWFVILDEGSRYARKYVKPDVRNRFNSAVSSLTNLGAKAGITVIVATQYPAVDEIEFRRGLISGVMGRVRDPERVTPMVLGRPGGRWGIPNLPDLIPGTKDPWAGLVRTTDYGGRVIRACNHEVEFLPENAPGYREPVEPVLERVSAPEGYEPVRESNVFPIYPDAA